MTRYRAAAKVIGIAMLVALGGCAQTTVQPEREALDLKMPRPRTVLVYRFATSMAEVQANQGVFQEAIDAADSSSQSQRATQIAQAVSNRLADELVAQINTLGLSAQRASYGSPVPPDAVAITGHFVDINEGNRARRLVIGLGAGQATVDAQVQVMAPSRGHYERLLEFGTHADSGAMPGAALTMGGGAAAEGGLTAGMAAANVAATGIKAYRSQIEVMAKQTADRSAEYLSQFFAQEGWIPPDKVKRPLLGS